MGKSSIWLIPPFLIPLPLSFCFFFTYVTELLSGGLTISFYERRKTQQLFGLVSNEEKVVYVQRKYKGDLFLYVAQVDGPKHDNFTHLHSKHVSTPFSFLGPSQTGGNNGTFEL